jgi:hypothetical protein
MAPALQCIKAAERLEIPAIGARGNPNILSLAHSSSDGDGILQNADSESGTINGDRSRFLTKARSFMFNNPNGDTKTNNSAQNLFLAI